MHVKGRGGYVDDEGVPRLSVLDVQMQIRRLPKPVIAMVIALVMGLDTLGPLKIAATLLVFLGVGLVNFVPPTKACP